MLKKACLTGLLLFGMFFGAGNLIFPITLGALAGENFLPATLGFVITGVGLAILGLILGLLNPKGYSDELSQKVSPLFSTVFLVALYLTIGPFFAIPRTAAVSFQVGIKPFLSQDLSQIGLFIFTLIYFGAALLISLNPSKIMNRIGKILTPIFALLIASLLILGIMHYSSNNPQAASLAYQTNKAFGTGFLEGYNTLDVLAAVAFSLVALQTLEKFGFKNKKEYLTTILLVGSFVALAFSIFYIGLAFLGNHFPIPNNILNSDTNLGVYVLSQATLEIFGFWGQAILAVMITLTCFTTTSGLIVSTSEFFHQQFPQLSYKIYTVIFTGIGFAIANLGLNTIIQFSVPVLQLLYPIIISFMVIILLSKLRPLSVFGMKFTIFITCFIAVLSVLNNQIQITILEKLLSYLPFHEVGLDWILPSSIGWIFTLILPFSKLKSTNKK